MRPCGFFSGLRVCPVNGVPLGGWLVGVLCCNRFLDTGGRGLDELEQAVSRTGFPLEGDSSWSWAFDRGMADP